MPGGFKGSGRLNSCLNLKQAIDLCAFHGIANNEANDMQASLLDSRRQLQIVQQGSSLGGEEMLLSGKEIKR